MSTVDSFKNIAEPSESDLLVDFAIFKKLILQRENGYGIGRRGSLARASADRKLKGTLRAIYKAD